jgi:cell division protein FtsW
VQSDVAITIPRLRVVREEEVAPAVARARAERSARRTVTVLTVSVVILTMGGLVMVLSASSVSAFAEFGSSFLFFKRQLMYAALGGMLAVGTSRLRYQVWRKVWAPLLSLNVVLLILVLLPSVGRSAGGAARWISVGTFSLQPSEPAKFILVAGAAAILTTNLKYVHADPVRWIAPLIVIVGLTAGLIMLQPDLGTAMVVAGAVFILLFVAGVRLRLLFAAATFTSLIAMALIMGEGYRRLRFFSFLHPLADPRNTGYQLYQSLIALGSGHLFGVGLGASRQKWMYMPNAHTDFIFAILGEELGLIGEIVVLALFGAVVYAGIRIALRAPDAYGRMLAAGITGWLGLQALVNLGAVTGLLPITGVPLPFISFGGSSLVVSLAAAGVLGSIGMAALKPPRRSSRRVVRGAER